MSTIEDLRAKVVAFRDARNWKQFHTLKNLLISLNLEAAELLELIQWKDEEAIDSEATSPEFRARLEEECADVFLCLLLISYSADFELEAAALRKIEQNELKYPIEKSLGTSKKYTELN